MTARVLVVDDSLTVRMDLTEAIAADGLAAVPCASIAEARRALAAQQVDVVLLDVRLPDGDGIDFLDELRASAATAALPILMLTSEMEVKDRVRGLATGATDYLGKPYETPAVLARIRQLLGEKRADVVLVIDDSATYRNAIAGRLTAAGYEAVTAADGTEGLRAAVERRPSAIVVDGVMPGMDGTAVIRRIRLDPDLRTTPCVMLTGETGRETEVRALEAGADAFVRKDEDIAVILARLAAVLRASRHRRAESAAPAELKRVLIVDDNPMYLEIATVALRADGYDVAVAISGEEAIELLAVQPVDCILLDRNMPGISGRETCLRIKSAPRVRDTPLIMVTADDGRDEMIDGLTAGADDFISKASGVDVLRARIRAQIRRKQIEDEHRTVRERLLTSELEARAAGELAEARRRMAEELERSNAELSAANRHLEAFAASVSHDLRAPLRAIGGFTSALVEDLGEAIDGPARAHLGRIQTATRRMEELIDALIELARITRGAMVVDAVDLSALCRQIADELARAAPERAVTVAIEPDLVVRGDARLMRVVVDNLLGNAWKFTSRTAAARVDVGAAERAGERVFFVRDNGAGFDAAHADNLMKPFQRMHSAAEFPGTGIGLATVQRVLQRHGGRIWAESEPDRGATFYFTVP
ncbi:MAG: response regulator [Deltaproteobacteria bacterium]|nr:response regulator [Deltaproteobacteria bacterium]